MRFITRWFLSLKHLKNACGKPVPFRVPNVVEAVPLPILDVNEGTKDGTVQVIEEFAKSMKKSDSSPVVGLVCVNFMLLQKFCGSGFCR